MNKKQKIHPVTIWMFAFVIIGLWAVYGQLADAVFSSSPWFEPGFVTIMLVFIAGVSLWTLPVFFNGVEPSPNDKGRDTLGKVVGFYVEAWNRLRGQKWLLWLFGSVAAFQFVNGLTENLLAHFMLADRLKQQLSELGADNPIGLGDKGGLLGILTQLPVYITLSIKEACSNFHAMISIANNISFVAIVIAAIAILMFVRVSRMPVTEGTERRFSFLKRLLLSFGIFSLAYGIISIIWRVSLYDSAAKDNESLRYFIFASSQILYAVMSIPALVVGIIADSILFAGYWGSLIRMRKKENIDASTFISDVSTFIKPILRLSLFLLLIAVVTSLPTIILFGVRMISGSSAQIPGFASFISAVLKIGFSLALIFVPYVILSKRKSIKKSIGASLRLWRSNLPTMAAFIAVGITLIVPVLVSNHAISEILPGKLYQGFVHSAVTGIWSSITYTLIAAIISLAIFNLYNYLTKDDIDEVVDTEPILEDPDPQQWSMREV
ncbi:MAG: hypothetical protein ACYC0V_02295 [Armatimonadota bacterium]